jgi:hypothetical protein
MRASIASCIGAAVWMAGCGGTLDAGRDMPTGLLPVDARNPLIIDNDSFTDNWSGEYAALFAGCGGPQIVGVIASASSYWTDANANATGWGKLVGAARASGLKMPEVTLSAGLPLVRPADGHIDKTQANNAAGAQLIV